MAKPNIVTIDLHFQDKTQAIASYLIRHEDGAVLVESGPGSTLPALEAGLANLGLSTRDVTHVLLSHIHLDHAGAAGWLSRQGAKIFVHPNGALHMLNPEKLIASATRIYGDQMQKLWGEFLPVARGSTVCHEGRGGDCHRQLANSFRSIRRVTPNIIAVIFSRMFVLPATWAACGFRVFNICARRWFHRNCISANGVRQSPVCVPSNFHALPRRTSAFSTMPTGI